MAGIFVRGLTGNKVNIFVDGVRYSNGAQRGGANTFLDLIEPEALSTIEVLRGPSSAQYGSDALGGACNSSPSRLSSASPARRGGEVRASFALVLVIAMPGGRRRSPLPPNIEGGTPAPQVWFSVRYVPERRRWWLEPYGNVAWKQTHLSSLDLGDRRIGAGRSRTSIQAFFRNGARARGWISAGTDGALNTADDTLIATGETLTQIQDRVLGVGVNSSLFPELPGYAVFGVRGGMRFGMHELLVDLENLTDENYRGISWGLDGSGRGISIRCVARF